MMTLTKSLTKKESDAFIKLLDVLDNLEEETTRLQQTVPHEIDMLPVEDIRSVSDSIRDLFESKYISMNDDYEDEGE